MEEKEETYENVTRPLLETITILKEQLRGTREELSRERKLKEEAMEKLKVETRKCETYKNMYCHVQEQTHVAVPIIESLKAENEKLKGLIPEGKGKTKYCPTCKGAEVIQFDADNDLCVKCNNWFPAL